MSEIIRNASMAPIEGSRKVMLLHEFHLLEADGAARLLKTIEEPPASAVFIVLADQVPPELVTVASRCVRIEFSTIPEATIRDVLIAEGATPAAAGQAAAAAAGNLTRARVLATDPGLMARREAFATVPQRLDGTGSNVVALCTELNALIDAAAACCSRRGRRRKRRHWRPESRPSANAAAAASSWRNATSASYAATVSTSCAVAWA